MRIKYLLVCIISAPCAFLSPVEAHGQTRLFIQKQKGGGDSEKAPILTPEQLQQRLDVETVAMFQRSEAIENSEVGKLLRELQSARLWLKADKDSWIAALPLEEDAAAKAIAIALDGEHKRHYAKRKDIAIKALNDYLNFHQNSETSAYPEPYTYAYVQKIVGEDVSILSK